MPSFKRHQTTQCSTNSAVNPTARKVFARPLSTPMTYWLHSTHEVIRPAGTFNDVPTRSDRIGSMIDRAFIVAAILAPLLYGLVINASAFDSPPAWDSAVTVSPAALAIVDHDFDVWEVAHLPSSPEGGPSTHSTSLYTIALAATIAVTGAETAFFLAHVTSILLVGLLTLATYLLVRERASVRVTALTTLAVGILPIVVQQASDIYLDLPLAVVVTLACWTTSRRWFWRTALLVLVAVALKTSGVFALPLLLVARPIDKPIARHLRDVTVAGLVASAPFVVALATTHRFSMGPRDYTDLTLIGSSASLLAITIDVFAVMSFYLIVMYGRIRARRLDRMSVISLAAVGGFVAIHVATMVLSGTIAMLPRYYIAILPVVLAAIVPPEHPVAALTPTRRTIGVILLMVLCIFSLANIRGNYYPRPDHDFYVAAERSTRAQDLLALQVEGTRLLVQQKLPLLVERQVYFRLEYPGMGYVDSTPDDITPVFLNLPIDLPDKFAMLIERRYTNPLVAVEEAALSRGYDLSYRELKVGNYTSQLVIASK
jgi:hypothetical protein